MATDTDGTLRSAAHTIIDELARRYARLDDRVTALEAARQIQEDVVAFSERRASWTTRQLADDLSVHAGTIRNWVALPNAHRMHLPCLRLDQQIRFLPEHIAEWLAHNEDRLPLDKERGFHD